MSLTLAVTGCPAVSFDDEAITLGSDARCMVQISDGTDVRRKHAHIRRVDGVWTIQAYAENTFTIGRSEPMQTHRLRSGDVIKLSSDSSSIVFDPIDDKPLALLADDKPLTLSTHEISLTETVPYLPVITPKETPTQQPARKAASIPAPNSRTSDSISTTSGTMRSAKSASSATITTGKGRSSASIRTTKEASGETTTKTRRSNAAVDTNDVLRRSLEMAIADSDASETMEESEMLDLPVLERLSSSSSWDDELPEAPRRRSSDTDEMKWILMVVGRALAAGAVVLVLLLIINAIRASMTVPEPQPSTVSVREIQRSQEPNTPIGS